MATIITTINNSSMLLLLYLVLLDTAHPLLNGKWDNLTMLRTPVYQTHVAEQEIADIAEVKPFK